MLYCCAVHDMIKTAAMDTVVDPVQIIAEWISCDRPITPAILTVSPSGLFWFQHARR